MSKPKMKTAATYDAPAPWPISQFGIFRIDLPPRTDGTSREDELASARDNGYRMLTAFDNVLPGDPRDTVDLARTAVDRESRDAAWQGAAKRLTIERIVNTLLDHALNRAENLAQVETYARDLVASADDGEISTVKVAETLERLANATEDAALAAALAAGAYDFWTTRCGGDFKRFDNSLAAYRRRKQATGSTTAKPTALDPVQEAMLARLKRHA